MFTSKTLSVFYVTSLLCRYIQTLWLLFIAYLDSFTGLGALNNWNLLPLQALSFWTIHWPGLHWYFSWLWDCRSSPSSEAFSSFVHLQVPIIFLGNLLQFRPIQANSVGCNVFSTHHIIISIVLSPPFLKHAVFCVMWPKPLAEFWA